MAKTRKNYENMEMNPDEATVPFDEWRGVCYTEGFYRSVFYRSKDKLIKYKVIEIKNAEVYLL